MVTVGEESNGVRYLMAKLLHYIPWYFEPVYPGFDPFEVWPPGEGDPGSGGISDWPPGEPEGS